MYFRNIKNDCILFQYKSLYFQIAGLLGGLEMLIITNPYSLSQTLHTQSKLLPNQNLLNTKYCVTLNLVPSLNFRDSQQVRYGKSQYSKSICRQADKKLCFYLLAVQINWLLYVCSFCLRSEIKQDEAFYRNVSSIGSQPSQPPYHPNMSQDLDGYFILPNIFPIFSPMYLSQYLYIHLPPTEFHAKIF